MYQKTRASMVNASQMVVNSIFLLAFLLLVSGAAAAVATDSAFDEDEKLNSRMQRDYPYNPYEGAPYNGGFGAGYGGQGANGYGRGGQQQEIGKVPFEFLCTCLAKSSIARNMLPVGTDVNANAQQQIQQLQEQIRKLQEQINRSQQGKSSFEQFAQMLSLADGLDCNCSGKSASFTGFPSSINSPPPDTNNFSGGRGGAGNGVNGGYGGYGGGTLGFGGGSGVQPSNGMLLPPYAASMGGAGRFPGQYPPIGQMYVPLKV